MQIQGFSGFEIASMSTLISLSQASAARERGQLLRTDPMDEWIGVTVRRLSGESSNPCRAGPPAGFRRV
jgi:hypothetical protein